jgi:hypothetical protein
MWAWAVAPMQKARLPFLSSRGLQLGLCHTAAGIDQLRAIVEPLGMRVTAVRMSKALHLKSAATALPDGKIIGHLPSLDSDHPFHDLVPTFEHEVNGAHVVNFAHAFRLFYRYCLNNDVPRFIYLRPRCCLAQTKC